MRVDKAQQGEARTRRRHREIPALSRHVGVALGVLMERYGITASEAYETLAEAARTQDCALDELATQVLRATEHANNWLNKPRPTKPVIAGAKILLELQRTVHYCTEGIASFAAYSGRYTMIQLTHRLRL